MDKDFYDDNINEFLFDFFGPGLNNIDSTRENGLRPNSAEAQLIRHNNQFQKMEKVNSKVKDEGILDRIGRNLTSEAREGLLERFVGREKELQKTTEILSRKIKNNPILVGEAGVGKTAIVEGLAEAISIGNVPKALMDKEIYSIDIANIEAGTQLRGAFEENVKEIIDEVKKRKNLILFFDEIHQILGAGSTGGDNGSKGLADIIKPALGRGEITIIGATTQDEYRNTILKNSALARRFNEVVVNEPNNDETFEILKGIREDYEKHHNVIISDEVLKSTINYSKQYIPQRLLPDKAIDLLDITSARIASNRPMINQVSLEEENRELTSRMINEANNQNFELAKELKEKIKNNENELSNLSKINSPIHIQIDDVADTVQRLTGIPVSQLSTSDIEKLKNINKRLKGKIIGQDEAVELVSRAIRRNRAGFDDGNKPIGSFLFIGPTGVGKTELAKQLAMEMFGSKESAIRVDMSEYTDITSVSKLIGTSAGYIGYDDNSNTLTEKVRRNPYSIILLDEIEKAHPQILTLLLQVMDDGRLTDGQGNIVNFKNTVIIATSNAGYDVKKVNDKNTIEEKLSPYFKPEFLNRFNGIVEFSYLNKKDLSSIIDILIEDLNIILEKKDITLVISKEVKNYLVSMGLNEAMGARPLRRIVERELKDKITDYYLNNQNIKSLEAKLIDNEITIIEI